MKIKYTLLAVALLSACGDPEPDEICANVDHPFSQSIAAVIVEKHMTKAAQFKETVDFRNVEVAPILKSSNASTCYFVVKGEMIAKNAFGVPNSYAFIHQIKFTEGGLKYEID